MQLALVIFANVVSMPLSSLVYRLPSVIHWLCVYSDLYRVLFGRINYPHKCCRCHCLVNIWSDGIATWCRNAQLKVYIDSCSPGMVISTRASVRCLHLFNSLIKALSPESLFLSGSALTLHSVRIWALVEDLL